MRYFMPFKIVSGLVLSTGLAILSSTHAVAQSQLVPITHASSPIVDEKGRVQYLIDLVKDLHDQFPDIDTAANDLQRFAPRHGVRARNMARALERQYGISVINMTSYVGDSITAYMTSNTVELFRLDPRVIRITEASVAEFSSPPWSDSSPVSPPNPWVYEMRSYGHTAMNGKFSVATGYPQIYVIDGGVGFHEDLQNVTRVSPSSTPAFPVPAIGCYSHATHVASIINATYGNVGTVGILPSVPIVSVSAAAQIRNHSNGRECGDPGSVTTPGIAAALDWVKHDIIYNGLYRVGIVNISLNSNTDWGTSGTLSAKVQDLATPYIGGFVFMGAFVAQSAGNNISNACTYSYANTSTSDGIMVVGGVQASGGPVTNLNGGYNTPTYTAYEPGSNWGSCVEVWAPSQVIWGAWGPNSYDPNDDTTWQLDNVTYQNYAAVGGTSFAAPHITALAAYLTVTQGLGSPSQIEAAVRNTFYNYAGYVDPGTGATIYMGILP